MSSPSSLEGMASSAGMSSSECAATPGMGVSGGDVWAGADAFARPGVGVAEATALVVACSPAGAGMVSATAVGLA